MHPQPPGRSSRSTAQDVADVACEVTSEPAPADTHRFSNVPRKDRKLPEPGSNIL